METNIRLRTFEGILKNDSDIMKEDLINVFSILNSKIFTLIILEQPHPEFLKNPFDGSDNVRYYLLQKYTIEKFVTHMSA